jgi:hypothetical protein
MADRVVGDLLDEPLAIGGGDAALLAEARTDLGLDALAQQILIEIVVCQLRAELGDDRRVDPVLDVGEDVEDDGFASRPRRCDPFAQFQRSTTPFAAASGGRANSTWVWWSGPSHGARRAP